ncbi:MAG: N-acetylmuramoyl-L-alanine amidase [Coriobacteriia bacterium]|nr:N-acetylmuramoyl-L-alanine amidase [Coriobacteriia bacterium]
MIAWQPSHQADTGYRGYAEYKVCGDIVDRTIEALPEFEHVKAWETGMGLTGSNNYRPSPRNPAAFDSELAKSNRAKADVFISIHNDGGAPSGVLGECMPRDARSRALTRALVSALSDDLRIRDRGIRTLRLYSLEKSRNHAKYRVLLEVGDNEADRKLLTSPSGRQRIAESIAEALKDFEYR